MTWKDGKSITRQLDKLSQPISKGTGWPHEDRGDPSSVRFTRRGAGQVVGTIPPCDRRRWPNSGVDLLLSGHFHIADIGYTAKRYNIPGYSALVVSSGTQHFDPLPRRADQFA